MKRSRRGIAVAVIGALALAGSAYMASNVVASSGAGEGNVPVVHTPGNPMKISPISGFTAP